MKTRLVFLGMLCAAVVTVLLPTAGGGQAAGSRHAYWSNTVRGDDRPGKRGRYWR